jgi:hypothetical protein
MFPIRTILVLIGFVFVSLVDNNGPAIGQNSSGADTISNQPDVLKQITFTEKKDSLNIIFQIFGNGNVSITLLDAINSVELEKYNENVLAGVHSKMIALKNYKQKSFVVVFRSREIYSSRKQVVRN